MNNERVRTEEPIPFPEVETAETGESLDEEEVKVADEVSAEADETKEEVSQVQKPDEVQEEAGKEPNLQLAEEEMEEQEVEPEKTDEERVPEPDFASMIGVIPEEEEYTEAKFREEAFDEDGLKKEDGSYEIALLKFQDSKMEKKLQQREQKKEILTGMQKIFKRNPKLFNRTGEDFLKTLKNPSAFSVEDYWNMYLEKTGQVRHGGNTDRTLKHIKRNLHKKASISNITSKVKYAPVTNKTKEELQAEKDLDEDYGDIMSF